MKRSLINAALLFALACTPFVLAQNNPSQTPSVDFGRTTVQFGNSFTTSMQALGVVIMDLQGNPLQNNAFTLKATGGALDLTSSAGEIEHAGGLLINAGATILRVQNFIIDTSNPTSPVITAVFIANNHFAGRLAVFNLVPPAGFSLPLQPQAGVLQVNGLGVSLAAATANAINSLLGGQYLTPGTAIGTADAYLVFAAAN
jgi:hypothetical protein